METKSFWHCLIEIKLWTTNSLPLRRMWEQRNKPVGNKDTEKDAANSLTKYKTEEREQGGGKGGQKRSKSRNQPIRAESQVESHCTISFGLEDSKVTGYRLCRDVGQGCGGSWHPQFLVSNAGALQLRGSWGRDKCASGTMPATLLASQKLLVITKLTGNTWPHPPPQKKWLHLKQASALLKKGS